MVIADCSFCCKPSTDVDRLVAGPGVYICNECVGLCCQLMEETPKEETSVSQVPPWELVDDLDAVLAHLPRVVTAATKVDTTLAGWVRQARQLGASWATIGDALGMTRQSAWERFAAET